MLDIKGILDDERWGSIAADPAQLGRAEDALFDSYVADDPERKKKYDTSDGTIQTDLRNQFKQRVREMYPDKFPSPKLDPIKTVDIRGGPYSDPVPEPPPMPETQPASVNRVDQVATPAPAPAEQGGAPPANVLDQHIKNRELDIERLTQAKERGVVIENAGGTWAQIRAAFTGDREAFKPVSRPWSQADEQELADAIAARDDMQRMATDPTKVERFAGAFADTVLPPALTGNARYNTAPADTLGEKLTQVAGGISGIPMSFVGPRAVAMTLTKNPVGQAVLTFGLHGQAYMPTDASVGDRVTRLGTDAAMGAVFSGLSMIERLGTPGKVIAPAGMFSVGYGMSKAEGASDEDAIISGASMLYLHYAGRVMPAIGEIRARAEAKKVLRNELTERFGPESAQRILNKVETDINNLMREPAVKNMTSQQRKDYAEWARRTGIEEETRAERLRNVTLSERAEIQHVKKLAKRGDAAARSWLEWRVKGEGNEPPTPWRVSSEQGRARAQDTVLRLADVVPTIRMSRQQGVKNQTRSEQVKRHSELEAKHKAGTITPEETAEAKLLVQGIAKGAGYNIRSYHGTNGEPFTVFDMEMGGLKTGASSAEMGIFSTDNRGVAQGYADNIGMGGALSLMLNADNPLVQARDKALATPEGIALRQQFDKSQAGVPDAHRRVHERIRAEIEGIDEVRQLLDYMVKQGIDREVVLDTLVTRRFIDNKEAENAPELLAAYANEANAKKQLNDYLLPIVQNAIPNRRVLDLFVNMRNPKVIDVQGRSPAEFPISERIAEAKREKHDGVIFKNIVDPDVPATHYVVFSPSQLKSADPFTGVPLDQRFNPDSPDIRMARESTTPPAENMAAVQPVVDRMNEGVGADIKAELIPSIDDVPPEFRDLVRYNAMRGGAPSAVYIDGGGSRPSRIFIFGNRVTPETVESAVKEELMHHGLREVVGRERWNSFLDQLYPLIPPKEVEEIARPSNYNLNLNTPEGRREAADEWMTHLADNPNLNPTLWERIVSWVKEFFRTKFKINIAYTEGDVKTIIKRSRDFIRTGKGGVGGSGDTAVRMDRRGVSEHVVRAERGERVVGTKASLLPREVDAIKVEAAKYNIPKNDIIDAVKATKRQHPRSDGWMAIEFNKININPDDPAKYEIEYNKIPYSFNVDKSGKSYQQGTPEYDKAVTKLAKGVAADVRKIYQRAAAGEVEAQNIIKQAAWYREMRTRLRREFGGLGDLFADLLGATSPNTPVRYNWEYAVDILRRASRGDFDAVMPKWIDWDKRVKEAEAEFLDWFTAQRMMGKTKKAIRESPEWVARRDNLSSIKGEMRDIAPVKESGAKYGFNGPNAVRALVDLWRVVTNENADIGKGKTAPKAINFSGNLIGYKNRATIDVWAARMLQRLSGHRRIPSVAEGGVTGAMLESGDTTLQFGFGQDTFTEAVRVIRQDPEMSKDPLLSAINDDDLQAVAWFAEKEVWTVNDWTSGAGEGGSFEMEANLTGSSKQGEIKALRKIIDSSVTKEMVRTIIKRDGVTEEQAKVTAAKELREKKAQATKELDTYHRTVDRFIAGASIAQSQGMQGRNYVPTNKHMAVVGKYIHDAIYKADAGVNAVLGSKVQATLGRYGDDERSFDIEVVTRENYDPNTLLLPILKVAQKHKQDSIFVSRILRDEETPDPLFHRPTVEVYFRNAKSLSDSAALLKRIADAGITMYTISVDPRRTDKALAGEMPNVVGVRFMVMPEFDVRFGDNSILEMPDDVLRTYMNNKAAELDAAVSELTGDNDISFGGLFWAEVDTVFSQQYGKRINDLTTGNAQAAQGSARGTGWRGVSVREAGKRANPSYGIEAGQSDQPIGTQPDNPVGQKPSQEVTRFARPKPPPLTPAQRNEIRMIEDSGRITRRIASWLSGNKGVPRYLHDMLVQREADMDYWRLQGIENKARIQRVIRDVSERMPKEDVVETLDDFQMGQLTLADVAAKFSLPMTDPLIVSLQVIDKMNRDLQQASSQWLEKHNPNLAQFIKDNVHYQTLFYTRMILGDEWVPPEHAVYNAATNVRNDLITQIDEFLTKAGKVNAFRGPADLVQYLETGDFQYLPPTIGAKKRAQVSRLRDDFMVLRHLFNGLVINGKVATANKNAQALQQAAMSTIQYYLGRDMSGDVGVGSGGMPIANLQARTLDAAFRALYGEVADPALRQQRTTEVQGNMLASMTLFNRVFSELEGVVWSRQPDASKGHMVRIGDVANDNDHKKFGPMTGVYVTREFADLLKPETHKASAMAKALWHLPQAVMRMEKLLNARTIFRNYYTGVLGFGLVSGDMLLPGWRKHWQESHTIMTNFALASMGNRSDKALEALAKVKMLAGYNAFRAGTQTATYDVEVSLSELISTGKVKAAARAVVTAYAFIDFPAKYAGFMAYRDHLMRKNPSMTEDEASKRAAHHVNELYQNRDRIPKLVGAITRAGLKDYLGYVYDSIRIMKNATKNAANEAADGNMLPMVGLLMGGAAIAAISTFLFDEATKTMQKLHAAVRPMFGDKSKRKFIPMPKDKMNAMRNLIAEYDARGPLTAWYERDTKTGESYVYYQIWGGQTPFPLVDWMWGSLQQSGTGTEFLRNMAGAVGQEFTSGGMWPNYLMRTAFGEDAQGRRSTSGRGIVGVEWEDPNRTKIYSEAFGDMVTEFTPAGMGNAIRKYREKVYNDANGVESTGWFKDTTTKGDIVGTSVRLIRTYRLSQTDFNRMLMYRIQDEAKYMSDAKSIISTPERMEIESNASTPKQQKAALAAQQSLAESRIRVAEMLRHARTVATGWMDDYSMEVTLRGSGVAEDDALMIIDYVNGNYDKGDMGEYYPDVRPNRWRTEEP